MFMFLFQYLSGRGHLDGMVCDIIDVLVWAIGKRDRLNKMAFLQSTLITRDNNKVVWA